MTSSQNSPERSSASPVLRFARDNGEVAVFLVAFVWLAFTAASYEQSARQFPIVFLTVGAIAMALELAIIGLPPRYSNPIRRMTTGLAADMGEELQSEDKPKPTVDKAQERRRLGIAIGVMMGFGVLAYLFSFLVAIPLFVFGAVHFIGTRNYRQAAIVSVVLMVTIYVTFGELMNVPLLEGVVMEWITG